MYDKELFPNDQVVLQFLSANKYKPKDTLSAMKEHTEFKRKYLPNLDPERVFPILVIYHLSRKKDSTTLAAGTSSLGLSWCLIYL